MEKTDAQYYKCGRTFFGQSDGIVWGGYGRRDCSTLRWNRRLARDGVGRRWRRAVGVIGSLMLIILVPLGAGVGGFISGLIQGLVLNFVLAKTGGLELSLEKNS